MSGRSRQRDLLPLPFPFCDAARCLAGSVSRGTRRRVNYSFGWRVWANGCVTILDGLYGSNSACSDSPSAPQRASLDRISGACQSVGKPPADFGPAGAFQALCRNSLPRICQNRGLPPTLKEMFPCLVVCCSLHPPRSSSALIIVSCFGVGATFCLDLSMSLQHLLMLVV